MITVDIQLATSTSVDTPKNNEIESWIRIALAKQDDAEVSIRIVDADESQMLNKQYRQKDKPTNVLSFPADFPEGVDIPFLGDLVICASVVDTEAKEQSKTINAHWAHMVIHGTLHLLGYDHIEEEDAQEMEALEIQLLNQLGYPNPYLCEHGK